MTDLTLVFPQERPGGLELVVNFGLFTGREATQAEICRLAERLVPELGEVEIVAEQRYEFDRDVEATVHQVRVELPDGREAVAAGLIELVEAWAQECISERRLLTP